MAAAMEIAAAQAEGRARSQGGDEQLRKFQEEAKRLQAREDGVVRAREEAEMLVEEERSRAAEEVRYGVLPYVRRSPPIYLFLIFFIQQFGKFQVYLPALLLMLLSSFNGSVDVLIQRICCCIYFSKFLSPQFSCFAL